MKNNIYINTIRIISIVCIVSLICSFIVFAANNDNKVTYNKLRESVTEIVRPTAPTKANEDSMSYILRQNVKDDSPITTTSNATINKWVNGGVIYQDKEKAPQYETTSLLNVVSPRKIRHTYAVAKLDEGEYQLVNDYNTGLIKVKICANGGYYTNRKGAEKFANGEELWAQNGFYKINDKTYYFDENALMVLGPAYDERGGQYFFSYETGELISEKH